MNCADLEVLARAHGPRQHPVGDVADQDVLERVLALAGKPHRRRRGRRCPSPEARRAARWSSRVGLRATAVSAPSQKVRPTTAACCTSRRSHRLERVETRGQQGLDRVRQLDHAPPPASSQGGAPSPRRTAGCRLRARRPRPTTPSAELPSRQQRADQLPGLLARQRVEEDRGRVRGGPRPSSCAARAARRAPGRAAAAGARTHWARYSIRSSIPWSAQWMSSNTSTSGLTQRHALDHRAHGREEGLAHPLRVLAVGVLFGRRSMPSSRPIIAALRSTRLRRCSEPASSIRPSTQLATACAQATSVESPSWIPASRAQHLAQRPVDDSRCRTGGSGPRARSAPGRVASERRSNSSRRRDLPTPAWPITVTRCGRRSRCDRLVDRRQQRRACRRARPAASRRRSARGGRTAPRAG